MSSTSTGENSKLSQLVVDALKAYGYTQVLIRYGVFLNPITVPEIVEVGTRLRINELKLSSPDQTPKPYRRFVLTAMSVCVPVVWSQFSRPDTTDEVHKCVAQQIAAFLEKKMQKDRPLIVWPYSKTVEKPIVKAKVLVTTSNGETTTQLLEGPGAEFHVRVSGVWI